jgi:uncharacterized damage-inducible protein DinB
MRADAAELAKAALIEELEDLHDTVRSTLNSLSEAEIWQKPLDPGNSVGHLTLHLIGNLNHFVGGQLGGTGYVRERELEFTTAERIDKKVLLAKLEATVEMFRHVVSGLTLDQLASPHPEKRFGLTINALFHLVVHFAIHRGQMSYITRLLKRTPS